jgi:hypothetical protein
MSISQQLPQIITAIGGLGTAAFGLVDSTKVLGGGVNRIGFGSISETIKKLTPGTPTGGLTQDNILATLKANWYGGTDLVSQKAIAKSLIKQGLCTANAATMAAATGVDATVLGSVAAKISSGTPLVAGETDVFARFDFILTAMLDQAYQHSSQIYTNWTRVVAAVFAVVLALLGGWTLFANVHQADPKAIYWFTSDMWLAFIAGLLATPLAPIAKDLSSALATAVNTMQAIRK